MKRTSAKSTAGNSVRKFLGEAGGNATMITALAAIPLIATAGMAIDYMRALRSAGELQQVADAAALAAASAKNVTGTTSQQLTKRATIATNYVNSALPNVQDIEVIGTPTVTTGPNTIDVTVKAKVKGSLINVLNALPKNSETANGSGGSLAGTNRYDTTLNIHSKVGWTKESYMCLLALNPTATEAIYFQGNSEFYATCAVHANSSATVAMRTWGNAEAYATAFTSVGGWAGSGFEPNPTNGASPKADPYGNMTLPTAGSCVDSAYLPQATSVNGQGVKVKNNSGTAELKPGTYCGGLHITTHGKAKMKPGLYIMKDGTLDIDANSELTGEDGVVIYLTGASAYIDVKSGAVFKIKAPTAATAISGSTSAYKGFAIMQDRLSNVGGTNSLYSKGGVDIEGGFYTPSQKLVVWANDTMNSNSKYFPMIVDTLNMNGTATLYVNLNYANAGFEEPVELKTQSKVYVTQ